MGFGAYGFIATILGLVSLFPLMAFGQKLKRTVIGRILGFSLFIIWAVVGSYLCMQQVVIYDRHFKDDSFFENIMFLFYAYPFTLFLQPFAILGIITIFKAQNKLDKSGDG